MGGCPGFKLVFFMIAVNSMPAGAAQPLVESGEVPSFRVHANLVELFVSVRRGDRFVAGLGEDDILVYDGGVLRELAFFRPEGFPLSIALVLDTSASMAGELRMLQAAAAAFLESLREGDEVAIFTFGGMVKQLTPLTTDRDLLMETILSTFTDGGTPLYDALTRAISSLGDAAGRKAVVLFTDGEDTRSRTSLEGVVRMSGRAAIPIFAIGMGQATARGPTGKALERLSDRTGARCFFIRDSKEMGKAFAQVSENLRASYYTGFYTSRDLDGKWHPISVELRSQRGDVLAREGYYAR
jgi:Ca-activated chloride channel homolog